MKRLVLLLLVLFSFSIIATPQSLDKKQELSESVDCERLDSLYQIAESKEFVGNTEEAIRYYRMIFDGCIVIDSCSLPYVNVAYLYIEIQYAVRRQIDSIIPLAKDYLNKLDLATNPFINEKINILFHLSVFDRQNMDEAIAYGKRAECLITDTVGSEEMQSRDSLYFEIVYNLAYKLYEIKDFREAKSYYQKGCDLLTSIGRKDTKDYYFVLSRLFCCAYELGEYHLVLSLAPELKPMIFKYSKTPLEETYGYAIKMFESSLIMGKLEDALSYNDEIQGLKEQLFGGLSAVDKANYCWVKALISYHKGQKQEAMTFISQGNKELTKSQERSFYYYEIKAKLLDVESQMTSEFEVALAKSDTAVLICEQLISVAKRQSSISSNSSFSNYDSLVLDSIEYVKAETQLNTLESDYSYIILHRGIMLFDHGAFSEAYSTFLQYRNIIKSESTINHISNITCDLDIALCQMEMGRFSDAINTLDNLKHTIETTIGTNNYYYARLLLSYALYYKEIREYDKLVDCCEKAALISEENGDNDGFSYALMNIGTVYYHKGNLVEATKYLKDAVRIMESSSTSENTLSKIYQTLFMVSYEMGNIEESDVYVQKATQLVESNFGRHSIEFARLYGSIGVVKYKAGIDESYDCFRYAVETMLSIGKTDLPFFLSIMYGFGVSSIVFDKSVIKNYSQLLVKAHEDHFNANTLYYSSSDRAASFSDLSVVKSVLNSLEEKDILWLYNSSLFSKSLMLATSNRFKDAVYESQDDLLIKQYERILSLQKVIDNQSFINLQDGLSVEKMRDNLVRMERDLIGKMKASGAYTIENEITFYDVAKSLKPNETAIEFVDFYHLKDKKTYYVALLAKSNWDKPVYVQLCTEDELKACLGNPNVTYSTDDLYRLLWQPLAEYINEGDKVYFSSSGMLHTIALESLHTLDGSCLSDKYNLVRLTSTRELCKEKQTKSYETGAVYGGLQYDVEQQRMAEVAALNKTELEESHAFALRGEDRGNWNYLQGTKDEAEHIAGIMQQANIGCNLFEGDLGSEESFKALSGGSTDIIHLATHGYFLENEKADMNDFMKSLSPLARQKTDSIIDPLLRSGLILSGGNRAWLGKEVPEGIEDGVLTALEISTMNLSGTDMVVMSACETGLGDITSDGVFGLQRAFKMAGVQTLVMSLWKVDDNATSLMMQTFYEHLLSGMSKREAFNLAQAAVRTKYPEPYYWAGFVMLD